MSTLESIDGDYIVFYYWDDRNALDVFTNQSIILCRKNVNFICVPVDY